MKKNSSINIAIVLAIIIFAIIVLMTKSSSQTDKEIVKCIGENSVLYNQIGCHYCEKQKEMFGENSKYLNIFLCNSDDWKTCLETGITGTPSWKINNQIYKGVQSIQKLKELTGC